MCTLIHYKYRCGCDHMTVFPCPRIGEANQQRHSSANIWHCCERATTHLDEPCQECATDPFGTLGRPAADENADAHRAELAAPMDEQRAVVADGEDFPPAEDDDHDLENIDPDQEDDTEHRPASDDGLDVASNETPVPQRRDGRRVLGEITLNLL